MAAAVPPPAAPPIIVQGPAPFFVENLFFKSYPSLLLPSPSPAGELLSRSSQSLSCSSKFGVLFIAGQGQGLVLLRIVDVLAAQTTGGKSHQKHVELSQIPSASVSFPSAPAPTLVAISVGEEFLALDTVRNGVGFVLIFRLDQFLTTPGFKCDPIAEVRASPTDGSKVSGISWNPGENMSNMLAINCDDGFLQIVTIKGVNSVEMCSYKGVVRSMCWSPKGKQLVVGKADGSLSQLKLDCAEAKRIPGPGGSARTPTALFWTSTTQFLINYVVDGKDIDLMQLDLVKGGPPTYTNFGDVFVSDRVDPASKCGFVPLLAWNVIVATSNTINDVIVLGKGLSSASSGENWAIADLNDNRRAAIPIDSFAVGATLFTGSEETVLFDETESYRGVPVVFVLSEAGALSSFALVNSKGDAPSLFQKVVGSVPTEMFAQRRREEISPPAAPVPPVQFGLPSINQNQGTTAAPFNLITNQPSSSILPPKIETTGFNFNPSLANFGVATSAPPAPLINPPLAINKVIADPVKSEQVVAPPPVSAPPKQQAPLFDMKQLPTTGLPNFQQVEDLKRMVEEKRAQGGFREAGSGDDEPDMDEMLLEVEKFQKRLQMFHTRRAETHQKTVQTFNEVRKEVEEDVVSRLNLMEDFTSTLRETKDIQEEEVNGIKERIVSHYTELEYAKALEERNKDPKYAQLLMAQPMDAGRLTKFGEIEKLYHYIRSQTAECERFFKLQSHQPNPLQNSAILQSIYQTLANHSKIIKRLAHNINLLRVQIGLGKTAGIEEHRAFEAPTMGHNYNVLENNNEIMNKKNRNNKPLLKERPVITIPKSNVPKIKAEKEKVSSSSVTEKLTVDDLTAGMSRVKLNRLKDAGILGGDTKNSFITDQKPMRISAKKLDSLTKIVSRVENIEISGPNSVDPYDLSVKGRAAAAAARSRNFIEKLDDKTGTGSSSSNGENTEIKSILTGTVVKEVKKEGGGRGSPLVKPVPSKPQVALGEDKVKPKVSPQQQQEPVKFSSIDSSPMLAAMLGTSSTQDKEPLKIPSLVSSVPTATSAVSSSSLFGFSMGSTAATTTSTTSNPPPPSLFGGTTNTFNFSSLTSPFGVATTTTKQPPVSSSLLGDATGKSFLGGGLGFTLSSSATTLPQTQTTTASSGLQTSSSVQKSVAPPVMTVPIGPTSIFGGGGISQNPPAFSSLFAAPSSTSFSSTSSPALTSLLTSSSNNNKPTTTTTTGGISSLASLPTFDLSLKSGGGTTPFLAGAQQSGPPPNLFGGGGTTITTSPATAVTNKPSSLLGGYVIPKTTKPLKEEDWEDEGKTASIPPLVEEIPKSKPYSVEVEAVTPEKEEPSVTITKTLDTTTLLSSALFGALDIGQKSSEQIPVIDASQSAAAAVSPATAATGSTGSVFGGSNVSKNLFGTTPSTTGTPPPASSLFGGGGGTVASTTSSTTAPLAQPTSTAPISVFGLSSALGATSPFGTAVTSTVSNPPSSIFGSAGIVTSSAPAPTSIFGSAATPAPVTSGGSLFGASPAVVAAPTSVSTFGGQQTPTTAASIFGSQQTPSTPQPQSGGLFSGGGVQSTGQAATGFSFASPTSPSTTGAFGSGSVFGGATTAAQPAFGGSAVFGGATSPTVSSSGFGGGGTTSIFGTSSAFGTPASTGSAFGSAFGSTSPPATAAVTSPFGGGATSVFGGGAAQPASPFSGGGGISTGSVFGGTTTLPTGGLFSGGGGSTAQSGFSFASPTSQAGAFGTPAPAAVAQPSSAFGVASPAFGSAPVFGGTPAFGSPPAFGGSPAFGTTGSTFGSAFGSGSPAATGGGSIFGGAIAQGGAPSFGALAQASPPQQQQQGFGGGGGGLFGSPQGQGGGGSIFGGGGQPTSPFGQAQPQQQSAFGGGGGQSPPPASFGGSAFSSWR